MDRFAFGENWTNFLRTLNEEKIQASTNALAEFLGRKDLKGLRFLDIGSGSGLSSLAARRLGAEVHSFDYDPLSVACTTELRKRYFTDDPHWKVEQGSALDEAYLRSLGEFDIVYSWGVLHHTGEMWKGLTLALVPMKNKAQLFVAIYNDQGAFSRIWWQIKKFYNKSGESLRKVIVLVIATLCELLAAFARLITFRNPLPFSRWKARREERGMSIWYDWVDWIGGFPFEVASPEAIFKFYKSHGLTLQNLRTKGGGWGCCEYLFERG